MHRAYSPNPPWKGLLKRGTACSSLPHLQLAGWPHVRLPTGVRRIWRSACSPPVVPKASQVAARRSPAIGSPSGLKGWQPLHHTCSLPAAPDSHLGQDGRHEGDSQEPMPAAEGCLLHVTAHLGQYG